MKKVSVLLVAVAVIAFLAGCGTTAKFVYPHDMQALLKLDVNPIYDKSIAVFPFDDYRSAENSSGPILLSYLPLVPYGWVEYERPDAARMFLTLNQFDFTPSEDLAKAAALSLRHSNLVKNAFFSFGSDKADYVMHGEIKSTKYLGRQYTYGLSVYGPYLWLLGLPAGDSKNVLTLYLYLKKGDKTIWEYSFDRSYKLMQGYYYNFGKDILQYSLLMQECMNEVIVDLAKKFKDNPDWLK